jgi:hypothetical protein
LHDYVVRRFVADVATDQSYRDSVDDETIAARACGGPDEISATVPVHVGTPDAVTHVRPGV